MVGGWVELGEAVKLYFKTSFLWKGSTMKALKFKRVLKLLKMRVSIKLTITISL